MRNNLGDHTQFSGRAFGAAAFGGALSLSAALMAGVMSALPGRRFVRRSKLRKAQHVRDCELTYLEARLAYAGREVAEAKRDAAAAREEASMLRLIRHRA